MLYDVPSCQDRRILLELSTSQAPLTRDVAASSTPSPKCVAQIAEFRKTFQLQTGLNLHTACFTVLLTYLLNHNFLQQSWLNKIPSKQTPHECSSESSAWPRLPVHLTHITFFLSSIYFLANPSFPSLSSIASPSTVPNNSYVSV